MASAASSVVAIKLEVRGDKELKQRLEFVDKKLKALESAGKSYGKDIDSLTKKQANFTSSLDATRDSMRDLNQHKFPTFAKRVSELNPLLADMNKSMNGIARSSKTMSQSINASNADLKAMGAVAKELRNNHLIPLDDELKQKKKDFKDLNDQVNRSTSQLKQYERQVDRTNKTSSRLRGPSPFGMSFQSSIKFAKIFGAELAVMSGAVGLFRGALWLGKVATDAWSISLQALGAAAGGAVAALAGVLAAQRELVRAQTGPLYEMNGRNQTNPYSISSLMSGILDNPNYAMFEQTTLLQSMRDAQRANVSTNQLQGIMNTVGNFAIVADNPTKAMGSLTKAFIDATKAGGAFNDETFKAIMDDSPELLKGFEELYGGTEGLKKALSSGKVSVSEFTTAFTEGRLKSMEPFRDALEGVNDTLIGRFKAGIVELKAQLIEMGAPMLDLAKGPLAELQRELGIFFFKIAPTIQKTMSELFGGSQGYTGLERFMDRLAELVNEGMPKLVGFGAKIRDAFRGVGEWFGKLGNWLREASTSWDTLFENILKPIGVEVWKTIEHAIAAFNETILETDSYGKNFASRIGDIGDGVRRLIDGFANMKQILAPVIDSFTRLLTVLSQLLALPGLSTVGAFGLMGAFLGRGAKASGGRRGLGGGLMGGMMSMFMPFMGLGGRQGSAGGGAFGRAQNAAGAARQTNALMGMMAPVFGGGAKPLNPRTEAFKAFWGQGGKTFAKTAGPMVAAAGLSYVGGMISGRSAPTDVTAQTVGGALSMGAQGAAIGALLGSIIPGLGTAIGGAIGGIGGAIYGGISGRSAAQDAQKKADEDFRQTVIDNLFKDLAPNDPSSWLARLSEASARQDPFSNFQQAEKELAAGFDNLPMLIPEVEKAIGDFYEYGTKEAAKRAGGEDRLYAIENIANLENETIEQRFKNLEILSNATDIFTESQIAHFSQLRDTAKEMYEIGKKYGVATADQLEIKAKAELDSMALLERGAKMGFANMQLLSGALDITNREALQLADSAGMNLSERLLTLGDVLASLGYSADKAANRANAAGRMMRDGFEAIEGRRLTASMDEAFERTGQILADTDFTGNMKGAQIAADDYVEAWMTKQLGLLQSGELTYRDFIRDTKESRDQQLMILGGQTEAGKAFAASINGFLKQVGNVSDFSTRLQYDPQFGVNLNATIRNAVASSIESGEFGSEANINETIETVTSTLKGMGVDPGTVSEELRTMIGGEYQAQLERSNAANEALLAGLDSILSTITVTVDGTVSLAGASGSIIAQLGVTGTGGSSNPGRGVDDPTGTIDDTTSSRLARTLARHASFTSQIPGSRQITSSFRTTNLGSPSSDHLTGAAYDLTGDNLGRYAAAVNGAGGFAEFHGSAGGRHLHVVPPQGDTSSPANVGGGAGSVTINAPITVTARDGQSAKQIAQIVMSELAARERSARERS